jgi:predicted KAP-like P-loop ATPase
MNFTTEHNAKQDIKDDKLGLKNYVEKVAKAIYTYSDTDALVLSVEGEWGSGKTSFINFLKKEIKKLDVENKKYYFIHFNPWLITDSEQMVKLFFRELETIILSASVGAKIEEFKKDFKRFVSFLAPDDVTIGINSTKLKYNVANRLGSEPKTLEESKNGINEYLKDLDKKIIIIIDDIDRLTDKETEHIFRLVKSMADFNNLIYILSYDKVIVSKALETFKSENGERYLEKIINYPLTLPKVHSITIESLLYKAFEALYEKFHREEESPTTIYKDKCKTTVELISKYIKNIRDTNQLISIVSFEYPIIYEDVNFFDFIILSVIKLKAYTLYEYIYKYQNYFMYNYKVAESRLSDNDKQIKDTLIKYSQYKILIDKLFDNKKMKCRLQKGYYIENYFSFSVSNNKLTQNNFLEISKKLCGDNFDEYRKIIEEYENNNPYFIEYLEDYSCQLMKEDSFIINSFKMYKKTEKEDYLSPLKICKKLDDRYVDFYKNCTNLSVYEKRELLHGIGYVFSPEIETEIKKILSIKNDMQTYADAMSKL